MIQQITATIGLLRDYVSRAQIAIKALEELEGKGIIPAGTIQIPEESGNKTRTSKPRPAAVAKRFGRAAKPAAAENGSKTCTRCRKTKPVAEFTCHGKGPQCKQCIREYQRAWEAKRRAGGQDASGPLPFVCNICHSKFSSRSSLDTHMELKHPE